MECCLTDCDLCCVTPSGSGGGCYNKRSYVYIKPTPSSTRSQCTESPRMQVRSCMSRTPFYQFGNVTATTRTTNTHFHTPPLSLPSPPTPSSSQQCLVCEVYGVTHRAAASLNPDIPGTLQSPAHKTQARLGSRFGFGLHVMRQAAHGKLSGEQYIRHAQQPVACF
ncbi:hypothetical protein E2C01_033645 [Portunus trituberculatus]|uniref:Uncharacterized protein n=1 Tax=Portunus trituberculatus TaxID=210409 RepID=A0A5B7F0P1_PORTR|nr:hypothetical protein [Portunus trituberculatus]